MTQTNVLPSDRVALEPCPFCGGKAKREKTKFGRPVMRWIKCQSCDSSTGAYYKVQDADAAWSTRHREDSARALVEALEKCRKQLCDLEDFINGPPPIYDIEPMEVRDYRHELYRKFEPLCRSFLAALASAGAQP